MTHDYAFEMAGSAVRFGFGVTRIDHAQHIVPKPPFLQRAGLKILDHHIGVHNQPLQQRGAVGLAQVQRNAALVARLGQPGQRIAARRHGPETTGRVAHDGKFDLDHVGAELAQLRGAERPSQERRHIEDLAALQRLDVDHRAASSTRRARCTIG